MWEAPFVVLVQDDSKQAMLEYANKEVRVYHSGALLKDQHTRSWPACCGE
jgi:hypothetical protein